MVVEGVPKNSVFSFLADVSDELSKGIIKNGKLRQNGNVRVERVDALLLVVHLRVDVGQLAAEPADPGPGVVHVRLEQVRVVLGAGRGGSGAHWNRQTTTR